MLGIKRESKWQFETAGNGGINIDVLAINGGEIILDDPSHAAVKFHFGGIGAGIGLGLKLPKVGKIELKPLGKSITGTVGPEAFPNHGTVYITEHFKGDELTRENLTGACLFADGGLGLIAGYSSTILLMGIDPARLSAALAFPALGLILGGAEPNAVLVIRGPNVGIQGGGGVAGYVGYLA